MGQVRNVYVVEKRIYVDPEHPETSDYDVELQLTAVEAIVDGATGVPLTQLLAGIVANSSVTVEDKTLWNEKAGPTHNHSGQGVGGPDDEGDGTDGSGGVISYNYLSDRPEKMAPYSHSEMHAMGGSDPITPELIGAVPQAELVVVRGDMSKQDSNIIDLALEVEVLKGVALTGVNANICIETFLTLDDITLLNGVYDQSAKKIYLP